MTKLIQVIGRGLAADRPLPADFPAGGLYYSTDTGSLDRNADDRTAWESINPAGAAPTGAAGGVLSGTYPNPGFAADMATQAELDAAIATTQPLDADLTDIAALSPPDDDFMQRKSGHWVGRTPAQAKADLAIVPGDVTGFDTQVRTSRLDQMAAPTADVSANSHKITNLAAPSSANDAARKADVDAAVAGLSWKQSVRAATTTAGTLASGFENGDTIDGVTLATGDRILIKDQAAPAENGIYTVNASGAPTRATDADSAAEILQASVYVQEGTINADTQWTMTANAPITLGTTGLAWAQLSSGSAAASGVTYDHTTSGLSATNVQAAIDELAATPPPTTEANLLIYQAAGVYLASGHTEADQRLHIYAGEDGKAWREIAGASAYNPPSSGVVRDPSIIRFRNRFWVVHTARYGAFDLIVSDDLITWTWVATISMGSYTGYTWAPEWFLDSDGSLHVFITLSTTSSTSNSNNMAIFEVHPTNAAMTSWSSPTAITVTSGPSTIIDVDVLRTDDGTYHLFYKDERGGFKRCNHATASTLLGPYTEIAADILSQDEIEGFSVVRIGAVAWRFYYNTVLTDGVKYKESYDDLATFGTAANVTGGSWSHSTIVLSDDSAIERLTEPLRPTLRAIASGDPLLSDGAGSVQALHDTTASTYIGRDAGGVLGFYATSGLGGGGGGGGTPSAIASYVRSTSQALGTGGLQNVQWSSEASDPASLAHLANTNNIDVVIDKAGYYILVFSAIKTTGSTTIVRALLNGTELPGGQTTAIFGNTYDTAVSIFSAVVNDVINCQVYNDSGSSNIASASAVLLRLPDTSIINWKGAWSGATAYAVNDAVSLSGSSYICILAHTNHTPPNATYWNVLASKGDVGSGSSVTVKEADGSPNATFDTLIFPNGSLTNNGDGSVTYAEPTVGHIIQDGGGSDLTQRARLQLIVGSSGATLADDSGGGRTVLDLSSISGGGGGAPTTAKYVTTAADATLSAEVAIPGLAAHADRSGVGGSTFSEEFDGSDPFTYSTTPTSHDVNSTYGSHWYASHSTNVDILALQAYAPGGDFDVRAKVGMGGIGGTGASIGIIVTDSGNANIAALLMANGADAARTINSYKNSGFTGVAGPVTIGTITTLYLRITRASNTARYWWSTDGIVWERIGEATSLSTTVAKVGFRFNSGASARYFVADWLRGITGAPSQA